MSIYTKKGDNGDTYLLRGGRVSKDSFIIGLLGTADELNASLGFLHTSRNKKIIQLSQMVQNDLFLIGAYLAGGKKDIDFKDRIAWLESNIDELDQQLPSLKNFILPGGSRYAAHLHQSRAICRRFERKVYKYYKGKRSKDDLDKDMLIYLNRLSDLLFVMARYVNFKLGIKDIIFKRNS